VGTLGTPISFTMKFKYQYITTIIVECFTHFKG